MTNDCDHALRLAKEAARNIPLMEFDPQDIVPFLERFYQLCCEEEAREPVIGELYPARGDGGVSVYLRMSDAWQDIFVRHFKTESESLAFIESCRPAAVPEGWQLVPRSLTSEMREILIRADEFSTGELWIMLLAVAPTPEKGQAMNTPKSTLRPTEAELRAFISSNPDCLSLLYDLNLMPEQVEGDASSTHDMLEVGYMLWRKNQELIALLAAPWP